MRKFKDHLNPDKENLEEAVDTGQGRVEHATVTWDQIDGMFIQMKGQTINVDITPQEMKSVMKGKPAKSVPVIKK